MTQALLRLLCFVHGIDLTVFCDINLTVFCGMTRHFFSETDLKMFCDTDFAVFCDTGLYHCFSCESDISLCCIFFDTDLFNTYPAADLQDSLCC